MRISLFYINTIKQSILSFDKKAKVFLFGSRVDNRKKGGDIDILVVSEKLTFSHELKIHSKIFKHIEEQKIDIIIAKKKELNKPFFKLIMPQAVPL